MNNYLGGLETIGKEKLLSVVTEIPVMGNFFQIIPREEMRFFLYPLIIPTESFTEPENKLHVYQLLIYSDFMQASILMADLMTLHS